MKTFLIRRTVSYVMEVEAESTYHALELAEDVAEEDFKFEEDLGLSVEMVD